MDTKRVLEALAVLEAELAGAGELDEQAREALRTLGSDIQRKVESGQEGALEEDEGVAGRLQDAVQEFGAEHPQIAGAVNQVAAALANLGI